MSANLPTSSRSFEAPTCASFQTCQSILPPTQSITWIWDRPQLEQAAFDVVESRRHLEQTTSRTVIVKRFGRPPIRSGRKTRQLTRRAPPGREGENSERNWHSVAFRGEIARRWGSRRGLFLATIGLLWPLNQTECGRTACVRSVGAAP
jgi:hypothetical protein